MHHPPDWIIFGNAHPHMLTVTLLYPRAALLDVGCHDEPGRSRGAVRICAAPEKRGRSSGVVKAYRASWSAGGLRLLSLGRLWEAVPHYFPPSLLCSTSVVLDSPSNRPLSYCSRVPPFLLPARFSPTSAGAAPQCSDPTAATEIRGYDSHQLLQQLPQSTNITIGRALTLTIFRYCRPRFLVLERQ